MPTPPALRFALLAMILLASCAAPAMQFDEASLGTRWIRTIEQEDWDGMRALLAEDAVYEDTTMRYFGGEPIHLTGPDAIVEFWRVSAEQSSANELHYTLLDTFETGGVIVMHLYLEARVSGEFWEIDRQRIPLSGKQTTVLTTENGVITHAHDHVDYAQVMTQVEEYRIQDRERSKSRN